MRKKFSMAFLLILLAAGMAALGGGAVYLFGPARKTAVLLARAGNYGNSFGCETRLGSFIFPVRELGKEESDLQKVEAEVFRGGSGIAIEVGSETVSFLTDTSVQAGMLEPMEMTILKNEEDVVAAVKYFPSAGSAELTEINTLILDKKTGFATWTKTRSKSFISDHPDAQVYYLNCN